MDALFGRLLREVNRLLVKYPYWLPSESCEISFYYEKLKSMSKAFQSFTITDKVSVSELLADPTLHDLVGRLLRYKKMSTRLYSLDSDPLIFPEVGDRLAHEVAVIYKACMQNFGKAVKECDSYSQYFASQFCFDKNKFQEPEPQISSSTSCTDVDFVPQNSICTLTLVPDEDNLLDLDVEQDGEVFVGFQAEASNLLGQLACITKKQLKVISIVGMAGLGKTTLARRLYNNPFVVSYFYVRAWVTCSQIYKKRDLLLGILKSVAEITDKVCSMDDNKLAHELYRALKGRRYLIVVDDMWCRNAWDDFKRCFPNDNNGSKIMITTRLKDVALHAQSDGNPLCLRFLTEEESFTLFKRKSSFTLFRRKAFTRGILFRDFSVLTGKTISRKCGGLPLAIVVIAGLLENNLELDWWAQVAKRVSSYIVNDNNQYMDTLALSYDHLPQHLRPCFLSFGAFPEDHDIPVRRLIWLWIAVGFIQPDSTENSLEDVAYSYLMDLTRRSLVIIGNKGSKGAIKSCRIHDLLRDLCLRKAQEENFSPNLYKFNEQYSYSCSRSLKKPSTEFQLLLDTHVLALPSKLIKALDISSINLFQFPNELLQLVHLRYLELRFREGDPPKSIYRLRKLQTLIMSSKTTMAVPKTMWKMINLKHLCIKSRENLVNFSYDEEPSLLVNMLTMSLVSPRRPCQNILARTPNLQKLGLCGPLTTTSGELKCPDLISLMNLKTLKLLNTIPLCKTGRLSTPIIFPGSLKNLTLSNTYLDWKEAWVFELTPNLEVLKLKLHAFVGEHWETSPKAFPCLKFLKLDELKIVTWTASRYQFPVLQRLLVSRCPYLMEIPEDFGYICTLEWIELSGCSDAATNSALDIQKVQESFGNDWPKILLNPGLCKPMH